MDVEGWGCYSLQDEGGIRRDEAGEATVAVGVVAVASISTVREVEIDASSLAYPVMVRVHFSPRVMPPSALRTPSSQPSILSASCRMIKFESLRTLDDLTDTNAGLEVTTTDGRVEPVILSLIHI